MDDRTKSSAQHVMTGRQEVGGYKYQAKVLKDFLRIRNGRKAVNCRYLFHKLTGVFNFQYET